ncbi:MAG: hypothetical protein DI598_15230, partial [Pseudopedobacter saltans]
HLMVSFAPFLKNHNNLSFWQYNKSLFLLILTSGLYSGVLYLGIALAIKAVGELWHVYIVSDVYAYVFFFIAFFFNTVFFLSKVPSNFSQLEQDNSYPKGLKVFTQYILIPLMSIYLVILFLYEINILIQRSLPNGIVSWLIMGYSVFGILSLLLIFPIRENEGNKWIRTFSRFFYIMLFPLLALLFIAISIRISDYGITEDRYAIFVIGIWLVIVAVYSLLKPGNIKFIPITLCIFALLSVYGPQSAPSLSVRSQLKQLREIINGKKNTKEERGYNVLSHFVEHYGIKPLQPLTNTPLAPIETILKTRNRKEKQYLVKLESIDTMKVILHLEKNRNFTQDDNPSFRVMPLQENLYNIDSYQWMYDMKDLQSTDSIEIDNKKYFISKTYKTPYQIKNEKGTTISFALDTIANMFRKELADPHLMIYKNGNYYANPQLMTISRHLDNYVFTIKFSYLMIYKKGGNASKTDVGEGFLLIKKEL